jgi:hypothetical protein
MDFELTRNVPAGAIPVQTAIQLTEPMAVPFDVSLPADLGNEKPLPLQLPPGPINVIFKKVRDIPD